MGENRALLQLDKPGPSSSIQLNEGSETLSKLFPDQPTPSRLLLPTAGFCVKTHTTQPPIKKVFINVCHTDGIPPPRDVTVQELAEVWCSGEPGNFRVPMSIAAPHEERDNHDVICDVYDVAVSSTFYDKVEKDAVFRSFLIQVAIEGIANKYDVDIVIDDAVNVLKKRKAMGNIQPHRVQVRQAGDYRKLVEEVSSPGTVVSTSGVPQGPVCGPDSSQYILQLVPGEMGRTLVARFRIPESPDSACAVSTDLKLHLGLDRMRLESISLKYMVDIFVPFSIDSEHAVAIFDCETDLLTVTVPVLNCSEFI